MCILAVLRGLSRRYPVILVDNRDELDRATSSLQINGIPLKVVLGLLNSNRSDESGARSSSAVATTKDGSRPPLVRLPDLVRALGIKGSGGVSISAIDEATPGGGTWMGASCVPAAPGQPPQLRLACLTNCYQCPSHSIPFDVLKDNSTLNADGTRVMFAPHESRGHIVGRYLEGGSLPANIYKIRSGCDPSSVVAANPSPTLFDGYSFVYGDVARDEPLHFTTNRFMANGKGVLTSPSWRAALSDCNNDVATSQDYRAQPTIPLDTTTVDKGDFSVDVLANTCVNNDMEPKNVELRNSVIAAATALRASAMNECDDMSYVYNTLVPTLAATLCTKGNHVVPEDVRPALFVKGRWTGVSGDEFKRLVVEKVGEGDIEKVDAIVATEEKVRAITHAEQVELHKNVYTDISQLHPATGTLITFKTRMQTVVVVERLLEQGGEGGLRLHYSYRTTNGLSDHGPWEAITIDMSDDGVVEDKMR